MTLPWYKYPVSQGFGQNGEQGVDLATPFHTPITAPYGGQVVESQYGGAGGIVGILTTVPGLGKVVEYFLHLDVTQVSVGQQVPVGGTVGLSGGETPAQVAAGDFPGAQHPAQPQFSTGPHVEYGFFSGMPFNSQDLGNPLPALQAATKNGLTGVGGAPSSGGGGILDQGPSNPICNIPGFGGLICGPSQIGQSAGNAAGQAISGAVGGLFEKIGFLVLAGILVLFGIVLVAYEPIKQNTQQAVNGAIQAVKSGVLGE